MRPIHARLGRGCLDETIRSQLGGSNQTWHRVPFNTIHRMEFRPNNQRPPLGCKWSRSVFRISATSFGECLQPRASTLFLPAKTSNVRSNELSRSGSILRRWVYQLSILRRTSKCSYLTGRLPIWSSRTHRILLTFLFGSGQVRVGPSSCTTKRPSSLILASRRRNDVVRYRKGTLFEHPLLGGDGSQLNIVSGMAFCTRIVGPI